MRTWWKPITAIVFAVFLGGCAISNAPLGLSQDDSIVKDLKSAAYNLDQAIAIGVLPEDDPAAGCVHSVLSGLGLDDTDTAAQTFMPKRDGLISRGAVLYIRARQLEKAKATRADLPSDCKAIIGQIVIDAVKVVRSVLPGARLISIFR